MQYFGVPKCPYCKKRVNLIRTWSLKRQGEYKCPRCGGISNIFLSPLIYVFALLAVFSGGAVYFFHKFVLDDISLSTVFQVLIPFAVFFLLSLFMVYLAKPVIKKIPKAQMNRKARRQAAREESRQPASGRAAPPQHQAFYDEQEYLPKTDYRTGPLPQLEDDGDMKILPDSKAFAANRPSPARKTSSLPNNEAPAPRTTPARDMSVPRPVSSGTRRSHAEQIGPSPARADAQAVQQKKTAESAASVVETFPARGSSQARAAQVSPQKSAAVPGSPRPEASAVSNEDFFAKYDDPAYVERRLRELQEGRSKGK